MRDGHLNKCKTCTKRDTKQHRQDNIDEVRAYDRQRSKEPERRKKLAQNAVQFREKYPEKCEAYKALGNALKRGVIKKEPCVVCGSFFVHAHHDDYTKPLDVVWLCPVHHKQRHAQMTERNL